MKKPLMQRPMLLLTLLAAPALALAARQTFAAEIAVHQTPTAPVPTITIPARSPLNAHRIANRWSFDSVNGSFRVTHLLPTQATLVSVEWPSVRMTFPIRPRTALALRAGEIVRLKIVPVRVRP